MPKIFRKKSYKKKVAYKKRTTKPSKALTKIVNSLIHKQIENKQIARQVDNTQFNSGISATGDAYPLLPTIVQGPDDGNRIGSKVLAKSLTIKGHFQLNSIPTTVVALQQQNGIIAPNCRIAIRCMIVTAKQFLNNDYSVNNSGAWMPYLLDNGIANVPFSGNVRDLYLKINRDAVTVHYDKVIYVNMPMQYAIAATGDTVVSMANSVRFFSKTIKMKKVLHYTDINDQAQNCAPMLICGYAHIDGSTPDTVTTACNVSFVSSLNYEDA